MIFKTSDLLGDLTVATEANIARLELLLAMPETQLNKQPAPNKWSAAQCAVHLNVYADFYLPNIQKAIQKGESEAQKATEDYKSGWLGEYFVGLMAVEANEKPKKTMPAPKNAQPTTQIYTKMVLETLLAHQKQTLQLLFAAKNVNLARLRIKTSISSLITMQLGDTFRFNVAHNTRHLLQALRATES